MQLFLKLPFRHHLHWLNWCKDSYTICSNTHHTHFLLTKLCAMMLRVTVPDILKDHRTFTLVIKHSPSDCLTLNNVHIIILCSITNYLSGNTA